MLRITFSCNRLQHARIPDGCGQLWSLARFARYRSLSPTADDVAQVPQEPETDESGDHKHHRALRVCAHPVVDTLRLPQQCVVLLPPPPADVVGGTLRFTDG